MLGAMILFDLLVMSLLPSHLADFCLPLLIFILFPLISMLDWELVDICFNNWNMLFCGKSGTINKLNLNIRNTFDLLVICDQHAICLEIYLIYPNTEYLKLKLVVIIMHQVDVLVNIEVINNFWRCYLPVNGLYNFM